MLQGDLFPPEANWSAPTHFPRLHGRVALDIECKDPNLESKGPGMYRGDGHIVGVAIAQEGFKGYFPVRHEGGNNLNPEAVLGWLGDELKDFDGELVGAHLIYDLDWLASEGITAPHAKIRDVQIAEPLLNENRMSYALENLAEIYLGEGKQYSILAQAVATFLGKQYANKPVAHLWRLPAEYAGAYAEADVDLPLRIYALQEKELQKKALIDLFELESTIPKLLLKMRQRGVRVDVARAQELRRKLVEIAKENQEKLNNIAGIRVNVDSSADIAVVWRKRGYDIPTTAKGNSSFTKNYLKNHDSGEAKLIMEIRRVQKMRGTFVDGYLLGGNINGRVHGEFHQLRSEEGGTVTGRFSSSHPNLQNLPSRDPLYGPLIRGLFIPEEGCRWAKLDWSQIEYRLIVHYACLLELSGADVAAQAYINDPETDFHEMVARLTGLERRQAKDLNFGMAYNMGKEKLKRSLNTTDEEAERILGTYHERAPFIKKANEKAVNRANERGYVRTILGRYRHFDRWEKDGEITDERKPGSRRAFTHKSFNSIIQGSAADIMKKAMVCILESGTMDVLGAPHLTVHDELDFSVPETKQGWEALAEVKNIMQTCVPLKVPMLCDAEVGPSWGEVEEWKYDLAA